MTQVCQRYPGFLRVFLQDPQPDRRFMRRGWLTFDHTVNIKEICWNLNNTRVITPLVFIAYFEASVYVENYFVS